MGSAFHSTAHFSMASDFLFSMQKGEIFDPTAARVLLGLLRLHLPPRHRRAAFSTFSSAEERRRDEKEDRE